LEKALFWRVDPKIEVIWVPGIFRAETKILIFVPWGFLGVNFKKSCRNFDEFLGAFLDWSSSWYGDPMMDLHGMGTERYICYVSMT